MLFDSNILIRAGKEPLPEIMAMILAEGSAAASVIEIEVFGFAGLGADEKAALNTIFERLKIYPLDHAVIAKAISIRQQRKIGLGDAIVAGTALVHGLTLATQNVADFKRVDGLDIINPFPSS